MVKAHLHPQQPQMSAVPFPLMGAVVVRRHPLDVLLSALNYAGIRDIKAVSSMRR
jgi:hypothetical protein